MAASININRRLTESTFDEPQKILVPISGYEKITVKSLEDACEPIKNMFDHKLKQRIIVAKMNSTDPEDGLSTDESASIHLYTMEWDVHENSLYMVLNRTLCLPDRTKLQPWFKYLKLFLTAFFKLPQREHTLVWRGVCEDVSPLYPKGKEFVWWAPSSWTSSVDVLTSRNYLGKSGSITMFSIQTNSGKHIRAHSCLGNDDEILLPPGIYLKVINSLSSADGRHIIHLQEIPPPFPLLAQPLSTKEEPQFITPHRSTPYSEKELACSGHACARCGYCRDWYWRPNGNKKAYTKHNSATCTSGYYGNYTFGGDWHYYYLDRYGLLYDPLCQCNDNRS